jgi:hypothetical protein
VPPSEEVESEDAASERSPANSGFSTASMTEEGAARLCASDGRGENLNY